MSERRRIFISSIQKEFAAERRALKDFVHADPLLSRFFDVFLFEDLPASDRRADEVYLDEVDRCDLYVGLYGLEYGAEDRQASPRPNMSSTAPPPSPRPGSFSSRAWMTRDVIPRWQNLSVKPGSN